MPKPGVYQSGFPATPLFNVVFIASGVGVFVYQSGFPATPLFNLGSQPTHSSICRSINPVSRPLPSSTREVYIYAHEVDGINPVSRPLPSSTQRQHGIAQFSYCINPVSRPLPSSTVARRMPCISLCGINPVSRPLPSSTGGGQAMLGAALEVSIRFPGHSPLQRRVRLS